jgi:hypothetical protein
MLWPSGASVKSVEQPWQLDGGRIKAEEVQPPPILPTALDLVEEGSVIGLQQVTSGALTMAASDQRLSCQGICDQSRA